MSKPLAKSLHTITVLVRVARDVKSRINCDSFYAVNAALAILGLDELDDQYGLVSAALKQMGKTAVY